MNKYSDYKAVLAAQLNSSLKALDWRIAKVGIGSAAYTLFDENDKSVAMVYDGKELVDRICNACRERLTARATADVDFNKMVAAVATDPNLSQEEVYAELCARLRDYLRISNEPQEAVFYARNRDLLVPFEMTVRFPIELKENDFLDRIYDESILFVSLQRPTLCKPLDTITRALRECGYYLREDPNAPNAYVCDDLSGFDGDTPALLRELNIVSNFAYDIHDALALEHPDNPEIQNRYFETVIRNDTGVIEPARVIVVVNQLMEEFPEICNNDSVLHDALVIDTINRFANIVDIADIAKLNQDLSRNKQPRSVERE